MERNKSGKARTWMVTWNNPTVETWEALVELAKPVKFMTGQLERGESGTDHWQFVLHFSSPRAFTALKKQFPLCHLEVAANITRAIRYCRKEDTRVSGPWTEGEPPTGSAGSAQVDLWDEWYKAASEGRMEDIPAKILIKFFGNLDKIRCKNAVRVDQPDVRGIWLTGPPGVGKSHWVRKTLSQDGYYPKPANKWWDGYANQNFVILEDLDHDTVKFMPHQLKIWADKWSFVAEAKGTAVFPVNRWLVVTSNYTMRELFASFDGALQEAIYRRFNQLTMISREVIKDEDCDKQDPAEFAEHIREFYDK